MNKDLENKAVCKAPWTNFYIDVNGNVKCCCFLVMSLGDLNENTLEEIWNGSGFCTIRENMISGDYGMCNPSCPFVKSVG